MSKKAREEALAALTPAQFRKLRLKPAPPGPAPRRLAVANSKGGVGKSTNAINVGAAFVSWGYRVRILDADAQGGSATKFVPPNVSVAGTLLQVYLGEADLSEVTCETNIPGLFIAPSNRTLAQVNNQNPPIMDHVLLDALEEDYERNGAPAAFDLEIIDTTPSLSTLMVTALVVATHVAIPMNLGEMDLEGLRELRSLLETVKKRANPEVKISAVIISRDMPNTLLAREMRTTIGAELPGVHIAAIPTSVRIMEMAGFQESIFTVDKDGAGSLASYQLAACLAEDMGCTWDIAPEDVAPEDEDVVTES